MCCYNFEIPSRKRIRKIRKSTSFGHHYKRPHLRYERILSNLHLLHNQLALNHELLLYCFKMKATKTNSPVFFAEFSKQNRVMELSVSHKVPWLIRDMLH